MCNSPRLQVDWPINTRLKDCLQPLGRPVADVVEREPQPRERRELFQRLRALAELIARKLQRKHTRVGERFGEELATFFAEAVEAQVELAHFGRRRRLHH